MSKKPIKPFLTYQQQLKKLSDDKRLIISDTDTALNVLKDINYYALIGGYKKLFYNPMNRQYISGTTFEDIMNLYYFDEALRSLVFKYLCHIEQKVRSCISYHFSEIYSHTEEGYLNPMNYNSTGKNRVGIAKLIHMMATEAHISTEHPYVVYQQNTYGNIPLWVMMNTMTFGQISKMYSFLTFNVQSKISSHFTSVNEKELGQYLKALTHFRNVCAHNERLYSYRCRVSIPDTLLHKKLGIPQKGTQYIMGKTDLFSVVIAFRFLLSKSDFANFKKQLSSLISSTVKSSHILTESILLNAMGFPENWSAITRYKI
ncbi:MAG: Abi family protein [Oscillospiraceae bacterium]|nr:Abi family protein [Oscillospiraceae bacterium]